jgi:hypothetical protein
MSEEETLAAILEELRQVRALLESLIGLTVLNG